eukprot:PhF_6_TR36152/c0_g1_i2/m.52567
MSVERDEDSDDYYEEYLAACREDDSLSDNDDDVESLKHNQSSHHPLSKAQSASPPREYSSHRYPMRPAQNVRTKTSHGERDDEPNSPHDEGWIARECILSLMGMQSKVLVRQKEGRWILALPTGHQNSFVSRVASMCCKLEEIRRFLSDPRRWVNHPTVTKFYECTQRIYDMFLEAIDTHSSTLTSPFLVCRYIATTWAPMLTMHCEIISNLDTPTRNENALALDLLYEFAVHHQAVGNDGMSRIALGMLFVCIGPVLTELDSFLQYGELWNTNVAFPSRSQTFDVHKLPHFMASEYSDKILAGIESAKYVFPKMAWSSRKCIFQTLVDMIQDNHGEWYSSPKVNVSVGDVSTGFVVSVGEFTTEVVFSNEPQGPPLRYPPGLSVSTILHAVILSPLSHFITKAHNAHIEHVHSTSKFIPFFRTLSEYYLCGKTDVWAAFCHTLATTPITWWTPGNERFPQEAFLSALHLYKIDPGTIPFTVLYTAKSPNTAWMDRLDGLRLGVVVPSALIPILNSSALTMYNEAFQFLVRV